MITNLRTSPLRLLLVLGALAAAPVACNDSTGNDDPEVPADLQLLSGDEQEAVAGSELPNPVVVRVLDSDGDPIRGQLVNFRVTSGGGSVFSGSALTNANGEAHERWTLGTSTAASQRLEARAVDQESGAAIVFGTFQATVLPGAPGRMEAVSSAFVEGTAGQALEAPIAVAVFDQHDNPVPGVTVSWTAPGTGSVAPASATTDASGRASAVWTLGTEVGAQTATATVTGLSPVRFTVTVRAGAPASLEIVSGEGQAGTVGMALAQPLVVEVRDAFDNLVPGAAVAWTLVSGSGTLETPSTVTDAAGQASTRLTLGTTAGPVRIRASTTTAPASEFTVTAIHDVVDELLAVSGLTQHVSPSESHADPPVVRAVDRFGNNVGAGVVVSWTVESGSGTVSAVPTLTDSAGRTQTFWALGPESVQTVRAWAGPDAALSTVFSPVFTARRLESASATLDIVSGGGVDGTIGTVLRQAMVVRLRDAAGQAVSGARIHWTVVQGSAVVGSPPPAQSPNGAQSTTALDGTAQMFARMGTTPGWVVVRASVIGAPAYIPPVDFVIYVSAGSYPNQISIASGYNQPFIAGERLREPIVAEVRDQNGNPLPGVVVTWENVYGSVDPTQSTTGSDGRASTIWTLFSVAGPQYIRAVVWGGPWVNFDVVSVPGPAAAIKVFHSDSGSGVVGTTGSTAVIRVVDAHDNGVTGQTVTWSVLSGSATLASPTTQSGQGGATTNGLTYGPQSGEIRIRASIATGAFVDLTETALPGATNRIVVVQGSGQTAPAGQQLPIPLIAEVQDQFGNPKPGVGVNWDPADASSGTVVKTPGGTDPNGRSHAVWTLGTQPGTQTVTARISSGTFAPATFTATATPPQ